jgi:tRNA (cytidine/uridine-2'-O-)-methyltransferase
MPEPESANAVPQQHASKGVAFHIVLLEPEIPNNTGNIGRTAAATGCRLHIVHPIGFSMDEKARRRAGLDYWHHVDCREHASWRLFLDAERPARVWLFTTKATRPHWDADFRAGDYLLFGKESSGVDDATHEEIDARYGPGARLRLPMVPVPAVRSLNLATAAAIGIYEGLRQLEGRGELPWRLDRPAG